MTQARAHTMTPHGTLGRSEGPPAGEEARARLLAGLPVEERRLRLDGVSTAVLEGGQGPPVVLLHGPGEYAAKWLRVIPALVATHRVIAPDLPGHGVSEGLDRPADAERVLTWLDALVERTCPRPPALVGQILGGAIAARFAAERPGRIARLVLIDALGLAPFQPSPEFGRALAEFVAEPSGETHDRLWTRCAFDLDGLRDRLGERWEWLRAYNLDRASAVSLQATQQALMEGFGLPPIPAEDLARIGVPTTLVWGRHDLATPLAVAEAASARYAWPLHVIDDCADDPPLEQPEAFLEVLEAALGEPGVGAAGPPPELGTRAAWDRIAPGYDGTVTSTHEWIAGEGLRRAGLAVGERFLDVASGSGALSLPAARFGARVVAVDQSPVMLELLRARAREEGLDVETRVMDGHALEIADETFDLVGSQFGVMLFPDLPKGLREMRRVARPGGRVLVHAYGDPHRIEFLRFLVGAVQSVRPEFEGPPQDPPPLEFQLADPERFREELAAAGLRDVRVETATETTEFESGDALWDWVISSNPIVERLLGSLDLTSEERDAVRQALDEMVRERAAGRPAARLTSPVHIGIGTK